MPDPPDGSIAVFGDDQRAVLRDRDADWAAFYLGFQQTTNPVMKPSVIHPSVCRP